MGLLMWDLANGRPLESVSEIADIARQLDVAGFNYHDNRWDEYHESNPTQPMICTEHGTFASTRGCYQTDKEMCHLAITDKSAKSYMAGAKQWHAVRRDFISGVFLWTGFDYYGEPTPYAWPAISSQFGIMDLCGYPKDFYYYYQSWWTDEPVLHLFPDWSGTEGEQKDIYVFSNCSEVELSVNGNSLGKKTMETDGYLVWENVVYQRGSVTAKGYCDGKLVSTSSRMTPGDPYQVKLYLDFQENDIAVIRAEIQDENGFLVPDAHHALEWTLGGSGRLLGMSNGDPSDHAPMRSSVRKAFHGLAQTVIRFDGEVTIEVLSEALVGNRLIITG
jgi:beta-galactosidase